MADATLHRTLQGHTDQVYSVAFSPDNKLLASASTDCTVRLWNIPNSDLNAELKGHTNTVYSVAFSPDGKSIVTGSGDETVRTWSVATKEQVQTLNGHSGTVYSVAWSPNGDVIASGGYDTTVILWDVISGSVKKKLTGHNRSVVSVSFSQDGDKLASAGYDDKTAIIWDVNFGAALITLAHSNVVHSIFFSRDDQFVVTGCVGNIMRMFNVNNGREEKQFEGHTGDVLSVACSFDGSIIASGSDDKSVRLWDVASAKQLQQLDGHTNNVRSVAFSRDGKFIASTSEDKTICLWNAPSSLQTPVSLLKSACFAGDVDAAKFQLDQGALVNNKDGSTALYATSRKGSKQLVELLIEHGADINLRENNCKTALHQAIIRNHASIVQLLLQWGADINTTDDSNRSALQLANQSKSAEIEAAFNQATSLQNKNMKFIPASALNQTAQFTLRLDNNKFGSDVWDTLTSSSSCKQFLVGLFLQSNPSLGIIPESAAKLRQLLCLSVADCGLASSDIHNLSLFTSLRALDLSNNPLIDIPNEFANLKELRRVSVSNCKLSSIPAFISQLPKIVFVDVSKNNINRVLVALASSPSLTDLVLSGNPLSSIPSEYHTKPTEQLFAYLRDLATESKPVYRSKLLLVGYGGVGKTTLLNALFPPESILEHKTGVIFKSWEKRLCKLQGSNFIFHDSQAKNGDWQDPKAIDIINALVETDDDRGLIITSKGAKHEFRCASVLQREEWLRACKFQAKNAATHGISVIYRDITSKELASALTSSPYIPPTNAPLDQQSSNRVPANSSLQLSAWDFAGQHEYQDGHQMFLTSRAVYLVLWNVTPSQEKSSLAQLRHWLSTIQLQLGKLDHSIRASALLYIVGTHADVPDVDRKRCQIAAERIVQEVRLTVPYRVILPISRTTEDVGRLKQQLLADLAIQQHLGEEVPMSYIDLDIQLRQDQDKFRLKVVQANSRASRVSTNENDDAPPLPMLSRSDLVARLRLESGLVTRALNLFQMWGFIIYLGESHPSLQDLIITAPEWLTVSVLGSLVQIFHIRHARAQAKGEALSSLSVQHSDLITNFGVWRSLGAKQDQVLQILYAFDLGFPADAADTRPFAERFSIFPQLLSPKPPPSFIWDATPAGTPELSRVVELNGVPMGFHTVLLSRLRAHFTNLDLPSCWRSGFVFNAQSAKDGSRTILVTIHEDSCRIRFCARNCIDFGKVFSKFIGTKENPGVLRQIISDRYKGVIIAKEYVECICQTCRSRKWKWNEELATKIWGDTNITALSVDAAAKSELSQAIGKHVQPKGSPHIFPIEVILSSLESKQTSLLCPDSSLAVSIVDLITISSTTIGSNEEYVRVVSEVLGLKKEVLEVAGPVDQSQIEYPIVIQPDPFVPVNTTGQETLAQLQALQTVTQDLIKSRLNEVSAQFQSNINDLMQQQQDLLAESHRDHEVRIKQLEEQVAEQKIALELFNAIVKPLDEWMRSHQLQTKEVDRIRQDEDFAAYYDTLQQVLNAAYTAALSVSSGIAVLNRNDTSAKVKKGLDLVGQHAGNVPFVSLVTGILSAVIDHFGEKNQREKLEKLLLLPNPTNMYTLFEDVARSATLSDARRTALKQPNQPESTFGEFFSHLKEKFVFSPRTTRSQKLAAADAERALTYIFNAGLKGEQDPNIIQQQLVATILQVDVKSISSNKPPLITPKMKPWTRVSVDKVVADVKGDHKALADNQERVEVTLQAKFSALEQELERQRLQIANQQSSHHRFIDIMSSLDEMEGQVSVENGATLAKVRQLILADSDLTAFINNRVFTFHLLRNNKLVKVNNEKIVLQADAVYIEFE